MALATQPRHLKKNSELKKKLIEVSLLGCRITAENLSYAEDACSRTEARPKVHIDVSEEIGKGWMWGQSVTYFAASDQC